MKNLFFITVLISGLFLSCEQTKKESTTVSSTSKEASKDSFNYNVDQFADLKILRYQVPSWDNLTLKEQKLVYYLVQAGLEGRDIMWDQNYRYNLSIRKALENIYTSYTGDKDLSLIHI